MLLVVVIVATLLVWMVYPDAVSLPGIGLALLGCYVPGLSLTQRVSPREPAHRRSDLCPLPADDQKKPQEIERKKRRPDERPNTVAAMNHMYAAILTRSHGTGRGTRERCNPMRKRIITAVTASVLTVGLLTAGAAAFAATQDDTSSGGEADAGTFIKGVPAPLIVTPAELAKGPVNLELGQALIVVPDANQDEVWTGTGGSDDDTLLHFESAATGATDDDASFNAGFSAEKAGTTKGWIAGPDGQRTTFNATITAP